MPTKYRIIVQAGPQQGAEFSFEEGETFIIGRGKDSHTQIQDPLLSRIHCRIDWIDDVPWLVDAQSTSGTFVNSRPVERYAIQSGDVFTIGNSALRFERVGKSRQEVLAENPWLANNPLLQDSKPIQRRLQELVGATFGQFRLDRILAEGSSGVVFKGIDTQKNEPVAVKVLEPDLDHQDEQKERFVRAMKTMINIRHPHIVQLYGAGKQGPYCWAAMQYVEGDSLAKVIDLIGVGNALPWREVFRVAVQIGRALEEASKKKLIHRNVTPRNIMRRSRDACHLLGDLMLAKALEGTQAREVTKPGQIVGELAYLPPERTKSSLDIDERSDLYGLGATLYALISGRPPASGQSAMSIIRSIREETPPRPSVYQKDIDVEFEALLLQLLEKAPNHRVQSAWMLLNNLESIAKKNRLDADWAEWLD